MLGAHADHFMLAQMRERVTAITPNAGGQSMVVPDRELPGTATVRFKGGYGMPGPQRSVSSSFVPGMGGVAAPPPAPSARSMLPGMGFQDMLPGMGNANDMLPGMGIDLTKPPGSPENPIITLPSGMSSGMKIGLGVAAAAALYFLVLKK